MSALPETMAGVQLTKHGGIDSLIYRQDLPVPRPVAGEVLVEVSATAKNNTDRKVREGLYPIDDDSNIESFSVGESPTLEFPRIQGADVVGTVVEVGEHVDKGRIGERGLLDFNIYPDDRKHINLVPDYYGHGADGGFAEFVTVPSSQFHRIDNPELSDAELASLGMCSYQTAFHMLTTAGVREGERILVTGASGGVGTALLQLCRLIGAVPYAVSSTDKPEELISLGAEAVIDRRGVSDWISAVNQAAGGNPIDAVMDLVGGEFTNRFIDVMIQCMEERSTYPRLSIAGAGASNVTEILWTKIYLYQVQISGVSHGTRAEAEQLVAWIRSGHLEPVLHGAFRLSEIHTAEEYFVNRGNDYLGKIVIVPDAKWERCGEPYSLH